MRIALNWFEVTLPTTELAVPVQTLATAQQGKLSNPETPRFAHRVVQRREETAIRLLHVTDVPPVGTTVVKFKAADDANFVKITVEEGFARLIAERGFTIHRKHVGGTGYLPTEESLFPDIYTFWRGLSFRAFYFLGANGVRWGIILNYATSQRFTLSLDDPRLRSLASGKRVLRVDDHHETHEDEPFRSGILVSVKDGVARVDLGIGDPVEAPSNEWT